MGISPPGCAVTVHVRSFRSGLFGDLSLHAPGEVNSFIQLFTTFLLCSLFRDESSLLPLQKYYRTTNHGVHSAAGTSTRECTHGTLLGSIVRAEEKRTSVLSTKKYSQIS